MNSNWCEFFEDLRRAIGFLDIYEVKVRKGACFLDDEARNNKKDTNHERSSLKLLVQGNRAKALVD